MDILDRLGSPLNSMPPFRAQNERGITSGALQGTVAVGRRLQKTSSWIFTPLFGDGAHLFSSWFIDQIKSCSHIHLQSGRKGTQMITKVTISIISGFKLFLQFSIVCIYQHPLRLRNDLIFMKNYNTIVGDIKQCHSSN